MRRRRARPTRARCQPRAGWGREPKSYDDRYVDTVDQIHCLVYLPGLASPACTTQILPRRPLWPAMQTSFPIVHACGAQPVNHTPLRYRPIAPSSGGYWVGATLVSGLRALPPGHHLVFPTA
ncbi:uncharacterized protein M421DRAFT_418811 [Didymella exigua CBS 183.55]|uniref:Uncharacterized protein n=1 Tax=Didymella exigua CBS 183.55 TaxID=1150837 RepID=A0A6A5RPY7_9PLEO|nr:uncharacterized protein M421DRAFT_418811 [Didymella exigua CBS 183.55]KAF1930501.1 hypothetical protein M421DRAFT_418811 [Didymella exigua CBS 183.55]